MEGASMPTVIHFSAVTLWAAIKQVQKSAMETGVSFKDYGKPSHCEYLCYSTCRAPWTLPTVGTTLGPRHNITHGFPSTPSPHNKIKAYYITSD